MFSKQIYKDLIEDYSGIVLEELLANSDLMFDELDPADQNDNYDLLSDFSWKDFVDENTRFKISDDDLRKFRILITYSKYFEYAFNNKHSKSKFEVFIKDIIKRESYILAILNYTKAFNERFSVPKFLQDTTDYLYNYDIVCEHFFKGL